MPPPSNGGSMPCCPPALDQNKMGGRGPRPGWNLPRPRSGAHSAPRAPPQTGKLVAPITPPSGYAHRPALRWKARAGVCFILPGFPP